MQTCPYCHESCPDENNYCNQCGTRLFNAKEWMPDFRNIREPSDFNPKIFSKLLQVCFAEETFRERLLNTLIEKGMKGMKSSDENKRYMGKEMLIIIVSEAMRYVGYGGDNTSDEGKG